MKIHQAFRAAGNNSSKGHETTTSPLHAGLVFSIHNEFLSRVNAKQWQGKNLYTILNLWLCLIYFLFLSAVRERLLSKTESRRLFFVCVCVWFG